MEITNFLYFFLHVYDAFIHRYKYLKGANLFVDAEPFIINILLVFYVF
jgi:hypothetical protein